MWTQETRRKIRRKKQRCAPEGRRGMGRDLECRKVRAGAGGGGGGEEEGGREREKRLLCLKVLYLFSKGRNFNGDLRGCF